MLTLKKNIDDKAIYREWLDVSSETLRRETNRVALQAFPPTVADWSAGNRPTFDTDHEQDLGGATSTIFAVDREKPLYPWVHMTGTQPHQIRATKPHGLLVFPIGSKTVFTRNPVNHPGFRPTGDVDRIQDAEYPKVLEAVAEAGERATS